jgi:Flp pilus assembly protein TadG
MYFRPRTLSLRARPLSGRLTAMPRRRRGWIGALVRDRRGMSAVEFGLAAPIFLAALSPVIDIGLAFSHQIRVNQAVEAGAQYAAMNPYNTSSTWSSNVSSAITNATTMSVNPSVGAQTCGCPNDSNTAIVLAPTPNTVSNCGTANGATGSLCTDLSQPGYYITISATSTYTSVMPYSILGSSRTLSSQAVVRIQ